MKIVNICDGFTDNWTYHENYLPKYQHIIGNEVTVIALNWSFDNDGKRIRNDKTNYFTDYGVKIIRLPIAKRKSFDYKFRDFVGLIDAIERERPDIIFVHSVQFVYIRSIVQYKKRNPKVLIYIDNHADFSNSANNWFSKYILHRIIWRYYARMIDPYVEKWYGVLPARVDFLHDLYGISKKKIDLLVMGADDEAIEENTSEKCNEFRNRYGIEKQDFLIVTGGKIDIAKQQVLKLMDAVNSISNPNIKLIIFGSVAEQLKGEISKRCSQRVQYIGWIKGNNSYLCFASADLVVFPGRHSVYWEQVAGIGKPMLCKDWPGTHHVDQGGNVIFLKQDSAEEMKNYIEILAKKEEDYQKMKSAAEYSKKVFSYKDIARKSIGEY